VVSSVLLSALAFKGIAEYLVTESPGSPAGALEILDKLILCLVIFSAVELIKTLAARMLSLRIHSDALFDSLEVLVCPHPPLHACNNSPWPPALVPDLVSDLTITLLPWRRMPMQYAYSIRLHLVDMPIYKLFHRHIAHSLVLCLF
jgi:hypothetical protein